MRIINRTEFLQLPQNTLYHTYMPQIFGELEIKASNPDDGWGNDFLVHNLFGFAEGNTDSSTNSEIIDTGEFKWDLYSIGRDGCFEEDQLFCVYDKEDIQRLINIISKCL